MKTDLVLTMDEYLNKTSFVPKRIAPPAPDARHVPISVEEDGRSNKESHMCRCDRWGHPCPDCVEQKPADTTRASKIFVSEKMR